MKWINRTFFGNPVPSNIDAPFAPVLFYVPKGPGAGVCAGRYYTEGRRRWVSLQGVGFSNKRVSHWMHMPNPPSKDGL